MKSLSVDRIYRTADDRVKVYDREGNIVFGSSVRMFPVLDEVENAKIKMYTPEGVLINTIIVDNLTELDNNGVKTTVFSAVISEKCQEIYEILVDDFYNECCAGGGAGSVAWGDITGTLTDQTDLDTALDALGSDITAAQSDITTLQSDVTTAQSDITTLQSDLGTAQTDITTLQNTSITEEVQGAVMSFTVGTGATVYAIFGVTNTNASETNRSIVLPKAVKVANLYIRSTTSQNASGSLTVIVTKNDVDTVVTLTIAAGSAAGVFSDVVNSVNFAAGDRISFKFVNAATSNSANIVSISCTYENV